MDKCLLASPFTFYNIFSIMGKVNSAARARSVCDRFDLVETVLICVAFTFILILLTQTCRILSEGFMNTAAVIQDCLFQMRDGLRSILALPAFCYREEFDVDIVVIMTIKLRQAYASRQIVSGNNVTRKTLHGFNRHCCFIVCTKMTSN
ncbi:unnamed protein product [Arctia plantaginis]|uniref:Uncharacterized protein n=1 Tax=Arctia plantaginis TaxID=874455 RepID=A0A8S1BGA0_ARCPL|nr:unnamed protein product [Arctia plantaginis]